MWVRMLNLSETRNQIPAGTSCPSQWQANTQLKFVYFTVTRRYTHIGNKATGRQDMTICQREQALCWQRGATISFKQVYHCAENSYIKLHCAISRAAQLRFIRPISHSIKPLKQKYKCGIFCESIFCSRAALYSDCKQAAFQGWVSVCRRGGEEGPERRNTAAHWGSIRQGKRGWGLTGHQIHVSQSTRRALQRDRDAGRGERSYCDSF